MRTVQYALHHLYLNDSLQVADGPGACDDRFDAPAYSWFKYGDGAVAMRYGRALLRLLIREQAIMPDELVFVGGSAYHAAPTAAVAIARAACAATVEGNYPRSYLKIDCAPYSSDYGAMDVAARQAVMDNSRPYVSETIARHIRGQKVVAIDDIRITGRHEHALTALFANIGVGMAIFCYVAILNQAQGEQDPKVEDRINHTAITRLDQIAELARQPDFCLNARTCKFILSAAAADRKAFAWQVPFNVLLECLQLMRADGYDTVPKYKTAIVELEEHARCRVEDR